MSNENKELVKAIDGIIKELAAIRKEMIAAHRTIQRLKFPLISTAEPEEEPEED